MVEQTRNKLYSLEILRFIAASFVFFGHYVHFYTFKNLPETTGIFFKINPSNIGSLAVPMFFMMSGTIFVHVYHQDILREKVNFFTFFIRRFARLYPLHVFTLLIVACLQPLVLMQTGSYFIYQYNNLKHFILQLFFMSDIGFEDGHSFNGPVWSVSNEMVLYLLFFALCFLSKGSNSRLTFTIFTTFIFVLTKYSSLIIFKSAFGFFVGCLVYFYLENMRNTGNSITSAVSKKPIIYAAGLFFMHKFFLKGGLPFGVVGPLLLSVCILLDEKFIKCLGVYYKKIASFLGSISYSTYLIHFPLQLILVLISEKFLGIDFTSGYMLLTYVLLVLIFSTAVSGFLEKPAQRYILSLIFPRNQK